ncbi:PA0069 family radical SAM protein [bacterium]|nr:PA0069 family radical SAM protein [bacterium]
MSDSPPSQPIRGRGASSNPANRFEPLHYEVDLDWSDVAEGERPAPQTRYFRDASESIIARNDSPDIPYAASLNPYRGCEHGCIYCYARPFHEFLGFSAGLDFETKIMVKTDAPELLRRELASPRWPPQALGLSGVTDPYQPIERKLQLTRRCLAVLAECRNPVSIITKNWLVTRDVDLLAELARYRAVRVNLSVTTLDRELAAVMEPRTSVPAHRLEAVRILAAAGVPVGVVVAPVIPGLTDHEIPRILQAAAAAGAASAGHQVLRLPRAVGPLFVQWLEEHLPERKEKVLAGIKEVHGGRLDDARFGTRMSGEGRRAEQIHGLFEVARRQAGLTEDGPELSTAAFRRPAGNQLQLGL